MTVTGTDRQNDLTDVDTGNGTIGLTPSTTHTSLEPIRSGARQHLVDTDNMEGMGTINTLAIWPTFVPSPTDESTYRTLMWKPSFPAILTRYLLAQIRAASRA